jgi:chromosome segregation ATPase
MINDLQAQVRLLNSKAAAAVDRLADYEDEIRAWRAEKQAREAREAQQAQNNTEYPPQMQGSYNNPSGVATGANASQASPPPAQYQQSRLSSLRSLLGGGGGNNTQRRNPSDSAMDFMPNPSYPLSASNTPPPPNTAQQPGFNQHPDPFHTLQSTLASERELRLKAETNLTQTQMELEELTAQLFGQANEMVAEERRARSKLEERVRVLEKREREKGERLKKLEGRVERVERVRGMLG